MRAFQVEMLERPLPIQAISLVYWVCSSRRLMNLKEPKIFVLLLCVSVQHQWQIKFMLQQIYGD